MSSLIEQLNELKRQQAILSCKIKEEEERKENWIINLLLKD